MKTEILFAETILQLKIEFLNNEIILYSYVQKVLFNKNIFEIERAPSLNVSQNISIPADFF